MTTPPGRTRWAPIPNRNPTFPAHLATTESKRPEESRTTASSLSETTRVSARASSLIAADRKDTRRCLDSTNVSRSRGSTSFRGIPGTPAPDPASRTSRASAGRIRRNSRLSRKIRSTIHFGSLEPSNRWIDCHLTNRFRYLWNCSASVSLRSRLRMFRAPRRRVASASVALGASDVLGLSGCALRGAVHELLLENLEHVRDEPVQDET